MLSVFVVSFWVEWFGKKDDLESSPDDKDHNEQICKQLNSDDQNFISGQCMGKTYANGIVLHQPPKLLLCMDVGLGGT